MPRYSVEKLVEAIVEGCIVIEADTAEQAIDKTMPWAPSDQDDGLDEAKEVELRATRLSEGDVAVRTILIEDGVTHYLDKRPSSPT
jgi:hypothetical protein